MNKELENYLKKKHEGDVFAHVYLQQAFESFWMTRDYYTIKGGQVFIIENGNLIQSGDLVFDTITDCVKVGKYNPKFKYKRTSVEYTYREIVKLSKL